MAEVRRQRSESKEDFRRCLNVLVYGVSLMDSGMTFQMRGYEQEKVHWPVVRFAQETGETLDKLANEMNIASSTLVIVTRVVSLESRIFERQV